MLRKVKVETIHANWEYQKCPCGWILRLMDSFGQCPRCGRFLEWHSDEKQWYCIESVPDGPNLYGYPIGQGPERVQKLQREYFDRMAEQAGVSASAPDETLGDIVEKGQAAMASAPLWRSVRDDPPKCPEVFFSYQGEVHIAQVYFLDNGSCLMSWGMSVIQDDGYWQPIVKPEPMP